MSWPTILLNRLHALREQAQLGGGQHRIDDQHRKGKLTARERLDILLDSGSFQETDMFAQHRSSDFGLEKQRVLGRRRRDGHRPHQRPDCVRVQPGLHSVLADRFSEVHAEKIGKVMDLAMKIGCPVIGLNDSGGPGSRRGSVSLGGYADIFLRNTLASGVIPQISAVLGPCAGGASTRRRSPISYSW